MSVETPPIFIQSGGETAERARRFIEAIFGSRGGIVNAADLRVFENGTPNMTVQVDGGTVILDATEATFQGFYVVENRGVLSVPISAADATNARKDLIVAKVQDAAYSGATNAASIVAVTGTPAASPAEPAVPANAFVLAMVDVPANDTAITNSQITDRRTTQSTQLGRAAALGGVIVCTSAARPAHSEGRTIYETDTDAVFVSDGASWVPPKNLLANKSGSPGNKFQSGTSTINATAGQTQTDTVITFPVAFSGGGGGGSFPIIHITHTDATSNSYFFFVSARSLTSFTVSWRKPDNTAFAASATTQLMWTAIGT